MSDEELRKLAKRLQDHNLDGTGNLQVDVDCDDAASAILALLEERDRLSGLLHDNGTPRFNEACRRYELAESRLGKAVEALREIASGYQYARERARRILSELEQSE